MKCWMVKNPEGVLCPWTYADTEDSAIWKYLREIGCGMYQWPTLEASGYTCVEVEIVEKENENE